jgi:hypothetical protein
VRMRRRNNPRTGKLWERLAEITRRPAAVEVIKTGLNLVGPLLTMIGALIAARAVIISESQAKSLSSTRWNGNSDLRVALLAQSRAAQKGLWCIVARTPFQVVALIYAFLQSYPQDAMRCHTNQSVCY